MDTRRNKPTRIRMALTAMSIAMAQKLRTTIHTGIAKIIRTRTSTNMAIPMNMNPAIAIRIVG